MNQNSSLAQQLFRAKLTHLLGSHQLKPAQQFFLDRVAQHYSPRALNKNLLAFIESRQPDLIAQLPQLYQEAQKEAETAQARARLVPPKSPPAKDQNKEKIVSFFKQLLPQNRSQPVTENEEDTPKQPTVKNLGYEYSLNTLSKPFIDGIVSLKVWEEIKNHLSPLEQRRWQKKLNQDEDGQIFFQLQQLYEQKSGLAMAELVDRLYQETVTWMSNALIDAARQTKRWQALGLNKAYLKALQHNSFEEMLKVILQYQQLQRNQ